MKGRLYAAAGEGSALQELPFLTLSWATERPFVGSPSAAVETFLPENVKRHIKFMFYETYVCTEYSHVIIGIYLYVDTM